MEAKVMELVRSICNNSTGCRGIEGNQTAIAELLKLRAINPVDVIVYEVPLNWNDQVVILYDDSFGERYELFAGIGTDGRFYFEETVMGE